MRLEPLEHRPSQYGPAQVEDTPGRSDTHEGRTDGHVGIVDGDDGVVQVGRALVGSQGADELHAVPMDPRAERVVETVGDEQDPGRHEPP